MKNKSIFTRQNQTLINLFHDAQHPEKVLCIPLDYAKATHVALCCNGSGTVFKKTFPFKNNPEGMCHKHHISREHVFQNAETAIGKLKAYVLPGLREGATFEELQTYYLQMRPKLLDKWVKAGAVHAAFNPANSLGQWSERIQAIYEIELPLPPKK